MSFTRLGTVAPGYPEEAEGTYQHGGKAYRLEERDSEKWRVYDSEQYLGQVVAVPGDQETGHQYTIDFAGEDNVYDEPAVGYSRLDLEYLMDNEASTVGG